MNGVKRPISYAKAQQSPIDFGRAEPFNCIFPNDYLAINWDTQLDGYIETNDNSTRYIFNSMISGNGLYLAGDFFPLDQMHFHAPSEHRINGAGAELELQVVHVQPAPQPENDQYVVLGIWVNAGDGKEEVNRFFQDLTERLKAENGEESRDSANRPVTLNPNDLLPSCQEEFWRYEGSLTTKIEEPNAELVRWVVYRQPILVSEEILKGFIAMGHHSKGVQPLNRRFVLSSIAPPPRIE